MSPSATGFRRRGWVVADRAVSTLAYIDMFTGCQRRLIFIGSQLSRETVPATTTPVAENDFESYFVVERPNQLTNWETDCNITLRPWSLSGFNLGVASHNRKEVEVLPLAVYICRARCLHVN